MKSFNIFLFFIIFVLSINYSFAGKGYDLSSPGVSWSVDSGTRYCPSGKELLGISKNKSGLARDGNAICITIDDTAPSITINGNGYPGSEWTNKNVQIGYSISDSKSGIKESYYVVNGTRTNITSTSGDINFSEEGVYNLSISSEDNATRSSEDGNIVKGNISTKDYIIKIDKSAPVITDSSNTGDASLWQKTIGNIIVKIGDLYKGAPIKTKNFTCSSLPAEGKWENPVINGQILGFCNPNDSGSNNCASNSDYTPNLSNCNWTCNDGYVKHNGACYLERKVETCTSAITLPTIGYLYDKNYSLTQDNTFTKAYWTSPSSVDPNTGAFNSIFSTTSGSFFPLTSSCQYSCSGGFHKEGNKCVNDISIICCQKSPLARMKDQGAVVDCDLPINQNKAECVYNSLCGGYIKDALGQWNYNNSSWDYTDGNLNRYTTPGEACNYENIPNSNGYTCNPGYYLVGENTANPTCDKVPIGEYSGQENPKHLCTNKPSNSTYTSNGTNNDCTWSCDNNYIKSGNSCVAKSCKTQPNYSNAIFVAGNPTTINQDWQNASIGMPCYYTCTNGYMWDGKKCVNLLGKGCNQCPNGYINGMIDWTFDGCSNSLKVPYKTCDISAYKQRVFISENNYGCDSYQADFTKNSNGTCTFDGASNWKENNWEIK